MGYQQFANVYKTWSNLELFRLLQNKDDYQPAAIEAATEEINARNLSRHDFEILQKEYEQLQLKKRSTLQKKLINKLELNKEKVVADLNPFTEKTIDRNIRLFCYSIGLIILFNFITGYNWIFNVFKSGYWNSSSILALMPFFFVPIGIYYFWKKQKFGWGIIAIWLLVTVVVVALEYIAELQIPDDNFYSRFFHKRGLNYYLILFLFFGSLLFYINTNKITEAFNIHKKFKLQMGAIAVFIILIHVFTVIFS